MSSRATSRTSLAVLAIHAGSVLAAAPAADRGFGIQLSEQLIHDDNLYRVPDNVVVDEALLGAEGSRDDLVSRTSLALSGEWVLGRQNFALQVGADANRFANNSRLDNTSGSGRAAWDWFLTRRWSGRFGADYERALSGFGNNRSLQRDLFETLGYCGDVRYRLLARWNLLAGMRIAETSHEDVSRRFDDLRSTSGTLGLQYKTLEDDEIVFEYRRTEANFPHTGTLAGAAFDRDYEDNSARVRVKYALSAKTSLTASAGYLERDYPQGTLGDFSGEVWSASLQWLPGIKTQVMISGWSELKAYLDTESDHFVAEGGRLEARWAPTRKLAFSLQYSREEQEYLGTALTTRRDLVRSPQAAMIYSPRDRFSLDLSWRLEQRESTAALFDYDDRIALFAVRVNF